MIVAGCGAFKTTMVPNRGSGLPRGTYYPVVFQLAGGPFAAKLGVPTPSPATISRWDGHPGDGVAPACIATSSYVDAAVARRAAAAVGVPGQARK